MNKESIYRIIGYNGEYNANVKKAIRKLLKENHPDNNGDRRIFELINEVKKELEENKVSISYKKDHSNIQSSDDIDYLYCSKMIDHIVKEKEEYIKILDKKKKDLATLISEYNNVYHDSIDLETNLLSNSYYVERLKETKYLSIVLVFMAIVNFIVSILTKKIIFLVIFVALAFICIIIVHRAFFTMQKIADNSRYKIKNYVGINNKIRQNQDSQRILKKEIHDLNKKINSLENDFRFYDNLIKNR